MSGFGSGKICVTVLSDAAVTTSSSLLSHLSAVIVHRRLPAAGILVLGPRLSGEERARLRESIRRIDCGP
jgi:hypothetical protein